MGEVVTTLHGCNVKDGTARKLMLSALNSTTRRLSPTLTAGEKDARRILIFEELKAAIDLLYKEHEEDDKHMYR